MADPFSILAAAQPDVPSMLARYTQQKQIGLENLYRQGQLARQEKMDTRADEVYQRGETVRTGLADAYDPATGVIDPAKARKAYVAGGDVAGAQAFDDHLRAAKADDLKAYAAVNEAALNLLNGVHDQASYDMAKAQAKQIYEQYGHGQHFPDLPPAYSPETVKSLQMQTLSTKERLDLSFKERQQTETERNHQATEGTARGNLALSQQRESRVNKWGPQAIVLGGNIRTDLEGLDQ